MRTPAPSSVLGWTMAVGWISCAISPTTSASFLVEAPGQVVDPPRELADGPEHLGQPGKGRHAPPGLGDGNGWCAEERGPGRHVPVHARLGPDLRPIADGHVIRNTDLAGQGHVAPDPTRSGDARLCHDDGVRANHGIMADLDEVVDLRPAS